MQAFLFLLSPRHAWWNLPHHGSFTEKLGVWGPTLCHIAFKGDDIVHWKIQMLSYNHSPRARLEYEKSKWWEVFIFPWLYSPPKNQAFSLSLSLSRGDAPLVSFILKQCALSMQCIPWVKCYVYLCVDFICQTLILLSSLYVLSASSSLSMPPLCFQLANYSIYFVLFVLNMLDRLILLHWPNC